MFRAVALSVARRTPNLAWSLPIASVSRLPLLRSCAPALVLVRSMAKVRTVVKKPSLQVSHDKPTPAELAGSPDGVVFTTTKGRFFKIATWATGLHAAAWTGLTVHSFETTKSMDMIYFDAGITAISAVFMGLLYVYSRHFVKELVIVPSAPAGLFSLHYFARLS
jgi:hypothetical protein